MIKTIDVAELKSEQIEQLQAIVEAFKAKNKLDNSESENSIDVKNFLTEEQNQNTEVRNVRVNIDVRELSGMLYEAGRKAVSLEEMETAIFQCAGESI